MGFLGGERGKVFVDDNDRRAGDSDVALFEGERRDPLRSIWNRDLRLKDRRGGNGREEERVGSGAGGEEGV